jgi:hypothetical protein
LMDTIHTHERDRFRKVESMMSSENRFTLFGIMLQLSRP